MNKAQKDVQEFHEKFGVPVKKHPIIPSAARSWLRLSLIREEIDELWEATLNKDLVKIADGITDSIYVLIGMAIEFGIDISPIWDEVHKTNMAKEGGGKSQEGKILKPDGWVAPDIERLLQEQNKKLEK